VSGSLALKLRVLRAERALTIEQVAARAGVTPETISDAERGRRHPYLPTLRKLASAYDVPVEELLAREAEEPVPSVPLSEATQTGPKAPTQEERLMSDPEVADWLIEQGHMDREKFLSEARELASLEEVEQAITELHETREAILEELRKPEVRARLFPRQEGLATKEERVREAFRPGRLAWKLGWEIRHEYIARETALVNYSRALFIEGEADDYLVRGPMSEHAQERHERMLEERQRVLGEKLAAAAAVV